MSANSYLTQKQQDTLSDLAQLITEGAFGGVVNVQSLARSCSERVATLDAGRRAQIPLAIGLLGGRIGVMLATGKPVRFAQLSHQDRRQCAEQWTRSRLPPVRSAWQAIRKLVLAVHYSAPEAAAAVGYAGPFRERTTLASWEGPLAADTSVPGSSPMARQPIILPGVLLPEPAPTGVVDGSAITADQHRTADVVIIGSGAGGAVAAAQLAEAGFEVVIVERGGWHTRADFIEDDALMARQLLAEGALRSTDDGAIALLQGETAGGSTTVNWMVMLRTPDVVLEEWARDAGLEAMGPRDMAPVFDRIERFVHAAPVPEEAHSPNNRIVLDGARALGWSARATTINARGCVRCGCCTAGCRHDAKQSALVTWLPRALAAGATLYTNVRADAVEVRERDTGNGTPPLKRVRTRVRDAHGAEHTLTIDAPLVLMAAGAVATPALLERSGLGGGAVGRYLRFHPVTACIGRYDREIMPNTGTPMTSICDEQWHWGGSDYGFWIETPAMSPWFAAAAIPSFGVAHAARMRQFNQLGFLIGLTRDGATRGVSNGRVHVDRRGATSIRYRLSPEDAQRVRASIGAMAELHLAAGAREVMTLHAVPRVASTRAAIPALMDAPMGPNQLALFSAHVNGTCRMGTDRATSGATPDGERHGVRGLYISDGSLLPTAPGVNPQETIMAVVSVLAARLAERHAGVLRG